MPHVVQALMNPLQRFKTHRLTTTSWWNRKCQTHLPKKTLAPHSSTLTWKIPWTEEPRRLQSMGSLRVRHDQATSLSLFTFMLWRRKWQPTPVFLPGESQGRGSLVGYRLWSHTESDTTEVTQHSIDPPSPTERSTQLTISEQFTIPFVRNLENR